MICWVISLNLKEITVNATDLVGAITDCQQSSGELWFKRYLRDLSTQGTESLCWSLLSKCLTIVLTASQGERGHLEKD